jgi:hypothetical protein
VKTVLIYSDVNSMNMNLSVGEVTCTPRPGDLVFLRGVEYTVLSLWWTVREDLDETIIHANVEETTSPVPDATPIPKTDLTPTRAARSVS